MSVSFSDKYQSPYATTAPDVVTQSANKTSGVETIPVVENGSESNYTETSQPEAPKSVVEDLKLKVKKLIEDKKIKVDPQDIHDYISKFAMHEGVDIKTFAEKLTPDKADKIYNAIETAIEQLEACHKELNFKNITDTMLLNQVGVDRKEYEEALANGEAKSIREELGLSEDEKITPDKVKDFMKKYVQSIAEKVKNGELSTEQATLCIKKKVAFIKISSQEPDGEALEAFLHALHEQKSAVVPVLKILLYGCSVDKQREMCEKFDVDFDKIVAENGLTEEDIVALSKVLDENFTSEELLSKNKAKADEYREFSERPEVKEFRKNYASPDEFFAREDVKKLQDKINNNEELTAEEETLKKELEIANKLATFIGRASSRQIVVTERGDNTIAKEMNYDNYQLDIYNDIMTNIKDYVAAHYEEMGTTVEEFASKMDAVTNGNYSLISENPDIAKSDLNLPKDPNATSNADLGYTAGAGCGDRSRVDYLTSQIAPNIEKTFEIVKNDDKNDTKKTYTRSELGKFTLAQFAQKGNDAIKFYIKTFGVEAFIENAITENVGKSVLDRAEGLYTNIYNTAQQVEKAEKASSYKIGKTYLSWLPDSVTDIMDKMGSFALTQALKEKQDKA